MTAGHILLKLRLEAERIGMTETARRAGMKASSNLYKMLREDGNPTLESVVRLAQVLGFQLELR